MLLFPALATPERSRSTLAGHSAVPCGTNVARSQHHECRVYEDRFLRFGEI